MIMVIEARMKEKSGTPLMLRCLRCDHEWLRRSLKSDPKQCPRCHSPYWNRPRRRA